MNGGTGIEVFAHDPKTGDGVIPHPFALLDELHRHPDMRLWNLWAGKLRKRGAQILGITTAGEPETPFEKMRDAVRSRADTRERDGSHLRAAGAHEVLHEWMVPKDELCSRHGGGQGGEPAVDDHGRRRCARTTRWSRTWATGKRLKCNRPTRCRRDGDHRQGVGRRRGRGCDPGGRGDRRWGWTWRGSGTRPRSCRSTRPRSYRLLGESRILGAAAGRLEHPSGRDEGRAARVRRRSTGCGRW